MMTDNYMGPILPPKADDERLIVEGLTRMTNLARNATNLLRRVDSIGGLAARGLLEDIRVFVTDPLVIENFPKLHTGDRVILPDGSTGTVDDVQLAPTPWSAPQVTIKKESPRYLITELQQVPKGVRR